MSTEADLPRLSTYVNATLSERNAPAEPQERTIAQEDYHLLRQSEAVRLLKTAGDLLMRANHTVMLGIADPSRSTDSPVDVKLIIDPESYYTDDMDGHDHGGYSWKEVGIGVARADGDEVIGFSINPSRRHPTGTLAPLSGRELAALIDEAATNPISGGQISYDSPESMPQLTLSKLGRIPLYPPREE